MDFSPKLLRNHGKIGKRFDDWLPLSEQSHPSADANTTPSFTDGNDLPADNAPLTPDSPPLPKTPSRTTIQTDEVSHLSGPPPMPTQMPLRSPFSTPVRMPTRGLSVAIPFSMFRYLPQIQFGSNIRSEPETDRIIHAMYALGFETYPENERLDAPAVTFFRTNCPPIERLMNLVYQFHREIDGVFPYLNRQSATGGEGFEVGRWKEDVLGRMMSEVEPALGVLMNKLGRKCAESLNANRAGVEVRSAGCEAI